MPSLLRDFSAPVKLKFEYSRDDLLALVMRDSNGFTRYEAIQNLAMAVLQDALAAQLAGREFVLDERLPKAYAQLLEQVELDKAMLALMLSLPAEAYIAEQQEQIDPVAICRARKQVKSALATALKTKLADIYQSLNQPEAYSPDAESIARRSLKNVCLSYLMDNPAEGDVQLCLAQLGSANNMTDEMAALTALVLSENEFAQTHAASALADFYEKWQHEALVVNQWFALQARNPAAGGLARVNALLEHPAYDSSNPNKIRSVIGSFCGANWPNFHGGEQSEETGGYAFLAQQIKLLDSKNPQIAARLLTPLTRWRRYAPAYGDAMKQQLEALRDMPGLSADCYEVVSKSLV